jgi:hypothetical protein
MFRATFRDAPRRFGPPDPMWRILGWGVALWAAHLIADLLGYL